MKITQVLGEADPDEERRALDLLDVIDHIDQCADGYHYRLRQHSHTYYYDLVLYASPISGSGPVPWAA